MAVAALKQTPAFKIFHAAVYATRLEQWCVSAEAAEEALELPAARVGIGARLVTLYISRSTASKTELQDGGG